MVVDRRLMTKLIRGVVRDPQGLPVPQARAQFLSGPDPLPDIAALTDSDGTFILSAPSPGNYRIECTADGFVPVVTSVDLREAEEAHLEISLMSFTVGPK